MRPSLSTRLPNPAAHPTLAVDAVAEILGLDRKTVYAAIHAGEIPSIRVGRRILVPTVWLVATIAPDPEPERLAVPRPPRSQPPVQGQLPL